MDITFLGHASFKIAGKSASLITDPFDPAAVGIKFPKTSADIVTLSHNHADHNFVSGVSDIHKVVDGPGEYEIRGISILGFQSFHDATKGSERGENTIYVYEVDEFRIAHLGDLGHKLDDSTIASMGDIDVLMIPVGGSFTIDAKLASEITHSIEPKIVIPMHYKDKALKSEIEEKLASVEEFVTALGLTAEHTKKLSLKQGGLLPEELKLIIVDRA